MPVLEYYPELPGQQVTIGEALEMYTIHGARSGGLEHEAGTLETGKRADLVVLNRDPTDLAPEDLDRLVVERTVCGGSDVYLRTAGSPAERSGLDSS